MSHLVFPEVGLLESVFLVHYGDGLGSAFTIEAEGSQYLVTAHHVVPTAAPGSMIELAHTAGTVAVRVTGSFRPCSDLDVCLLSLGQKLPYWPEPVYNTDHLLLGNEVGFLGFPLGLRGDALPDSHGWPLPFLKKGSVSGSTRNGPSGSPVVYLDGHNNPGFSGGPAFFRHPRTQKTHVFGVVTGFRRERAHVENDGYVKGGTTWVNAGIVECHPLMPVLKALKASTR